MSQQMAPGSRDRGAFRLAVLNTHPIQYFAPLYRRISAEPDIDLTVYFCSLQGAHEYLDRDFGTSVRWDTPLLEGYRWKLLPNLRRTSAVGGFWSLINPAVIVELRRERYDALWVHGHGHATHLLAALAARALGTPVLMRGETHLLLRRSLRKRVARSVLMRFLYNSVCSACLPIGSRNHAFYLAHGVPTEHLFLVPYAVDNDYFTVRSDEARSQRAARRAELGIAEDMVVILFAAKLSARKRPMDLLQAYTEVRRADLRAALLVVGSGEEESELRTYVEEHSVPDVHFVGFRNQSELPAMYALSDVFVLPSDNEPWGLAINEAMCAGLPIVAADEIGATADLVRHGENGFLYHAGDVATLRAHLSTLIGDPVLLSNMGACSREIIGEWSFDRCVDGVSRALGSVSCSPSPSVAHP